RRLRSRADESHQLRRGNELLHEPGPLDLQRRAVGVERPLRRLLGDGGHDGWMGVAEQQRGAAHGIVDVLMTIDVPLARAFRAAVVDSPRAGASLSTWNFQRITV